MGKELFIFYNNLKYNIKCHFIEVYIDIKIKIIININIK